jgi:hypothetical protein
MRCTTRLSEGCCRICRHPWARRPTSKRAPRLTELEAP